MQFDGPVSNGKPQAHAAAGALSRFTHAIKRLKDMLQLGFRNARAMIAHRHNGMYRAAWLRETSTAVPSAV